MDLARTPPKKKRRTAPSGELLELALDVDRGGIEKEMLDMMELGLGRPLTVPELLELAQHFEVAADRARAMARERSSA